MKKVRVAAKALIIQEDRILLLKCQQNGEIYYALPGGGQEHGERIDQALVRECWEEVGAEVRVKELVFVRDYISNNHQFKETDPHFHQIELMFACELVQPHNPTGGEGPDDHQIGVEWIHVPMLHTITVYPEVLKDHLPLEKVENKQVYLGDVN